MRTYFNARCRDFHVDKIPPAIRPIVQFYKKAYAVMFPLK
jgi:hypothetical protein